MIIESDLTILSVKTGMSGVVECNATVFHPTDSGKAPITAQEPVFLTVLGN